MANIAALSKRTWKDVSTTANVEHHNYGLASQEEQSSTLRT